MAPSDPGNADCRRGRHGETMFSQMYRSGASYNRELYCRRCGRHIGTESINSEVRP